MLVMRWHATTNALSRCTTLNTKWEQQKNTVANSVAVAAAAHLATRLDNLRPKSTTNFVCHKRHINQIF